MGKNASNIKQLKKISFEKKITYYYLHEMKFEKKITSYFFVLLKKRVCNGASRVPRKLNSDETSTQGNFVKSISRKMITLYLFTFFSCYKSQLLKKKETTRLCCTHHLLAFFLWTIFCTLIFCVNFCNIIAALLLYSVY